MNKYTLEKKIWTESDFKKMGWHDGVIHSLSFMKNKSQFGLDIDYIFQWVKPENENKYYRFWIAPATLIFKNASNIRFDIETDLSLQIDNIGRKNQQEITNSDCIKKEFEWDWEIQCNEGTISFKSTGYKMTVRDEPILSNVNSLIR